jgi:hypothetical protein
MEKNSSIQTVQQSSSTEVAKFNFFDPVQFETMQRVCKLFSSSELVPDMYKTDLTPDKEGKAKNPESKAMANCMIAIEMAQRIGASPLMIMQNMIIIYGRPSWSSKFLIATVNTCGRFNPLQYKFTNSGRLGKVSYTEYIWEAGKRKAVTKEFDGTQIDNLQCIAYTTSKGSEDVLESSPIDLKLAIQEGWYTKAGSKWVTMSRQMLQYRAASFWTNAYAPELSMGMKTEDEVQDIIDVDYEDVSDKVNREKAHSANKNSINIDEAQEVKPEEAKPEPEKVVANPEAKPEPPKEVPKEDHVGNFEAQGTVFEKPKTGGAGF